MRYTYPEALGLESRVEEDGGDIYGPAGTKVELTVTTDKPVARGALTHGRWQHGRRWQATRRC